MSIWSESAIKDNEPRDQYTASGGQTVFPYTFIIFDEDDLTVERTRDGTTTTLSRTSDYTVDSVGEEDGGDVTLTSGANADDTITIYRDLPVRRLTDFAVPGDYNPDTLNEELDKVIAMLQEQEVTVKRTIRLSPDDTRDGDDFELPTKDDRADKIIGFDENGDMVLTLSQQAVSNIDSIEAFTSGNRPTENDEKILGIETDTGRVIYDNGSWVEVGLSEDQIDLQNLNSLNAGNQVISGVNNPGSAKDAVNLQTLENNLEGLTPKPAARAATDGTNIDLTSSSDPNPIDGVTLADGDDVLLKDQSDGSENGLYTAVTATDPTTWTRTEEMDEDSEVTGGEHVFITEGTTNADKGFYVTSDNPTLGSDSIVWEQFMALGQVTAGDGLTKTGDQLDINVPDFAGTLLSDDGSNNLQVDESDISHDGIDQTTVSSDDHHSEVHDHAGETINPQSIGGNFIFAGTQDGADHEERMVNALSEADDGDIIVPENEEYQDRYDFEEITIFGGQAVDNSENQGTVFIDCSFNECTVINVQLFGVDIKTRNVLIGCVMSDQVTWTVSGDGGQIECVPAVEPGTIDIEPSASGNLIIAGDGVDITGNRSGNTIINSTTGDALKFRGRDIQDAAPSDGEVYVWNDSEDRWEPSTGDIEGSGDLTYVTTEDETADLPNSDQHPNLTGADLHDVPSTINPTTIDNTDYNEVVNALGSISGATDIDLTAGNQVTATLTADVTFSFTNPSSDPDGNSFILVVNQDGTGGHAITWPGSVEWDGGSAPSLTTSANNKSVISFFSPDAGTTWIGILTADEVA